MDSGSLLNNLSFLLEKVVPTVEIPETPAPPKEKELLLPECALAEIAPLMRDLGFPIEEKPSVVSKISGCRCFFYRVPICGGYIALLHVKNRFFELSDGADSIHWIAPVFHKNGAKGIIILSDSKDIHGAFLLLREIWLEQNPGLIFVEFFTSELLDSLAKVTDLEKKREFLVERFSTKRFHDSHLSIEDLKRNKKDRDAIVNMVTKLISSASGGLNYLEYLTFLINKANWPDNMKSNRISSLKGYPESDSMYLINYCLEIGINPINKGNTLLGDLLITIAEEMGAVQQEFLLGICNKYGLVGLEVKREGLVDDPGGNHG